MAAPTIGAYTSQTQQGPSSGADTITLSTDSSQAVGNFILWVGFGTFAPGTGGVPDITPPSGFFSLTTTQRPSGSNMATRSAWKRATTAGAESTTTTFATDYADTSTHVTSVRLGIVSGIQSDAPLAAPVTVDVQPGTISGYSPSAFSTTRRDALAVILYSTRSAGGGLVTANGWSTGGTIAPSGGAGAQGTYGVLTKSVTSIGSVGTMPAFTGADYVFTMFALHGFPDFFAYGVQTGTPTGPSAAYGVY